MPTFEITAPLKGFTGRVVEVDFKAGRAEITTDTDQGRAAYAYFERAGYRIAPVEDEPEPTVPPEPDADRFDPSEHKVDDVLAYLDTASYEVAVRVLDAEAAGNNRVTITSKRDEILAAKTPADVLTSKGADQ